MYCRRTLDDILLYFHVAGQVSKPSLRTESKPYTTRNKSSEPGATASCTRNYLAGQVSKPSLRTESKPHTTRNKSSEPGATASGPLVVFEAFIMKVLVPVCVCVCVCVCMCVCVCVYVYIYIRLVHP
jgi:hypothetical protein